MPTYFSFHPSKKRLISSTQIRILKSPGQSSPQNSNGDKVMFYRLTDNKKFKYEIQFTQIQRVSDGQLGGWIESESNLAQDGSWIGENSYVFGSAVVYNNSSVFNSTVENSLVENSAISNSTVENSLVENNCVVYDSHFVNSCVKNSLTVSNSIVENEILKTNPLTANPGKHPITVCDEKTAVGNKVYIHDYWLNNIVEFGKQHSYSDDEIELYLSVMTLLINQKKKELHVLF